MTIYIFTGKASTNCSTTPSTCSDGAVVSEDPYNNCEALCAIPIAEKRSCFPDYRIHLSPTYSTPTECGQEAAGNSSCTSNRILVSDEFGCYCCQAGASYYGNANFDLYSYGTTDAPTESPTNNPTTQPTTGAPTAMPTTYPTMEPTLNPTPYPTLRNRVMRNYTLRLEADYDAFNNYARGNYTRKQRMATQIIESGLGVDENPSLSAIDIMVLDVRKGSIIIDYVISANNEMLIGMASSNMNDSLGSSISIGNLTFNFASNGILTPSPTAEPTVSPTPMPTTPTTTPTVEPTVMPNIATMNPTAAPIPDDVSCGDTMEATFNGEWEYYLDIDNDSIVTFDTCSSYLNLFSMRIYMIEETNDTLYAECIECGSICFEESQFRVALEADTYLMVIDGPHKFEMICEPEPFVSGEPTLEPTREPTLEPTPMPTCEPKPTLHPNDSIPVIGNVSVNVNLSDIMASTSYLSDPFGRFEAEVLMRIVDENGTLIEDMDECHECFIWQYQTDGTLCNLWCFAYLLPT